MTLQTGSLAWPHRHFEALAETRRKLSERLPDPTLTDHDRRVLRRFAEFLDGLAPEPATRKVPTSAGPDLRRPDRPSKV